MNPKLLEFWRKPETQFFIDFCRVVLIILVVIAIIIFVKEIETVKILGSDVCKLCMEKTGCFCRCTGYIDPINYSGLNISWTTIIEKEIKNKEIITTS